MTDAYGWVLCRNSVHALTYVGGDMPLSLQTQWSDVGIAAPHNACLVNGVLHAYLDKGSLVRMGNLGGPEDDWAADVVHDMADWEPADTITGYDPRTKLFVVANGADAIPYNTQTGRWCPPVKLSDFAAGAGVSAVTTENRLKLGLNNAGVMTLYDFDQGAGSHAVFRSPWLRGQIPDYLKHIMEARCSFEHDNEAAPDVTVKIFGDMDDETVLDEWTEEVGAGRVHALEQSLDLSDLASFAVQVEMDSTGDSSQPLEVTLFGVEYE
jgi:hypothetical protein